MATIDDTGLVVKSQQSYLVDIKNKLLSIDRGWDVDPATPDGMKAQSDAEALAKLEENFASIYASIDPASAIGKQLDRIGKITNTPRKGATFGTNIVTFYGNSGALVKGGTAVRHKSNGSVWTTNGDVEIGSNGYAKVAVTCTTSGAISANIGTLDSIQGSFPAGITSCTNESAASMGQNEESDEDYRSRRERSVATGSANSIDSIYSKVSPLEGVKNIRVYENKSSIVSPDKLAPRSVMTIIDGGVDVDIAKAIASVKVPGVDDNELAGINATQVTLDTETPSGNPVRIAFFRPKYVSIFVRISITSTSFSDADKESLKQDIINYAASGYQLGSGFEKHGFGIGEGVKIGRLYTPVNSYVGDTGTVNSLEIGLSSSSLGLSPIDIAFNELAVFDKENINIEVITS